jgi:hypothetical protein
MDDQQNPTQQTTDAANAGGKAAPNPVTTLADSLDNKSPEPQQQQQQDKPGEQQQEKQPTKKEGEDDPNLSTLQRAIDAAVKPYADRLAKLEGATTQRERQRQGEDARDDYIRTHMQAFPRAIVRDLMPATTDETALRSRGKQIEEAFDSHVKHLVVSGLLAWGPKANVGGANREGGDATGKSVLEYQKQRQEGLLPPNPSPQQLLASDLGK